MQTLLGPALPFLSLVIRALIAGTRLEGGIEMFSAIRQFERTFLTDKYAGKGNKKENVSTARTSLSMVKGMPKGAPNADARPSAIGKVFVENPRCGSRARDSDVPSFLLSLCYGFRWDLRH